MSSISSSDDGSSASSSSSSSSSDGTPPSGVRSSSSSSILRRRLRRRRDDDDDDDDSRPRSEVLASMMDDWTGDDAAAAADDGSDEAEEGGGASEEDEEDEADDEADRLAEGAKVYVRDARYAWLPGTITSPPDDRHRAKVKVTLPPDWDEVTVPYRGKGASIPLKLERIVRLDDRPHCELPLQNLEPNGGPLAGGKDDLADLKRLHEAAILYNLKVRHASYRPYTRVGDILVAVNPFSWIEGLYSEERRKYYADHLIWRRGGRGGGGGGGGSGSDPGSGRTTPSASRRSSASSSLPSSSPSASNPQRATAALERRALGYAHEKLGMAPHVYETASLAYSDVATYRRDQTILVTGESGAGKTETIKIVMGYLATAERTRPGWPESDRERATTTAGAAASAGGGGGVRGGGDTVERVLQANPLFEAFGNAKTLRNDNSSRFGKFTQLQFDVEDEDEASAAGRTVPSAHLAGSRCVTYLLEKSRVVGAGEGERMFHIFYQLLGAPERDKRAIWDEGLAGAEIADFAYLSNTGTSSSAEADGLASAEHWPETVGALSVFGVSGDAFLDVMRCLCVILQLGNVAFGGEVRDGEERAVVSSAEELGKLSMLVGVPSEDIEKALTQRVMTTRGEDFTIFLKKNEARDGCDALAKEIYARVFDRLVTKCNESTEPEASPADEHRTISLLDIFGFESFAVNRFEQLCINYANERLQQKYVVDNFQAIKHEYEEEGINVFDFSLVDNTDVVELLEGRLGLITQLNEECVKKVGTDENFVYKLKVVNSDSGRVVTDHLHRPYEFGIRHYAASIKYDARMFMERNLDKIPPDLMACACQSSNPLLRQEFQQLSAKLNAPRTGGLKKRSEATKHLVLTKFKNQLTSLMSLIEESRTRYIRCVKPNKTMTPRMMEHAHTVSQLESAGLVTAIVISRESFPNRLSYDLLMERFKFLVYKYHDVQLNSGDIRADSEILLSHLLAGVTAESHLGRVKPFSCGKTRVYFRAGALEQIETIRQEYYAERAVQVQAWIRSCIARQRLLALRKCVVQLQCQVRCWIARAAFVKKIQNAVVVQCFARKCIAQKELKRRRENNASTLIQTRWRGMKPRQKFKTICKAALRLQCFHRMITGRKALEAKKKERDEHSAIENRMSMIQQTFDDATTVQGTVFSVDEGLLDEVETMFEFLRKEIVVLRKKNAKLKKDLSETESDKREIFNHASSVDHALALSKIRTEQMSKTNMSLLDDNNKRRREVNKLKNELKTQQQAHEAQLQEMRAEFEMALSNRELEVTTMQQNLHTSAALHKREVQMVREEAERKKDEHFSQISRLREEIRNTQDSHQDYLSKLMNVLETTQESRRSIPEPSDDMILRQKDDEIANLRDEISRLRQNSGTDVNGERTKKETVKSMKYIIKKNRENRKARVQQLGSLASQMEESLALGDLSQMQRILKVMKETVHSSEKSNSKMDREMVNMIDNTASYIVAQDSTANVDAALVAENQKLRHKLEKKQTCKKCGAKRGGKGDKSVGENTSIMEGVRKGEMEV